MMTRAELLELLTVERHLPLPPAPRPGLPHDSAADQRARRQILKAEVEAFEQAHPNDFGSRHKPRNSDETVTFVRRGLIYVQGGAA
ncbi:hypothetical protein [Kribbella deserti]|uniref:Uncharacterized protein n=1 Tax=Kribbella deserti TaxID=1926257 RepID=A0ABV6QNC5_9ACTN